MPKEMQRVGDLDPTTLGRNTEADRRSDPRTIKIFKAASLTADGLGGLCIIKNVSSGGAMLKTSLSLSIGERVQLELASGTAFHGYIVWQQEELYGLRSDGPVPVAVLLSNCGARRVPRLVLNVPIRLASCTGAATGSLVDISTHGLRITSETPFSLGAVLVLLPGLRQVSARILWVQDQQAGCVLDKPFTLDELTAWAVTVVNKA